MIFLYNICLKLFVATVRIAAKTGHSKAKNWVEGRENIFELLKNKIHEKDKIIWFHAASLGEFEQGRPLIEKVKANYPDYKILLTFYSPSGYVIRKNYPNADIVTYLPADSRWNAVKFLDLVKPSLIVFIKYEFWYHFLHEATLRKIHTIYIAALFRPEMIYFSRLFTLFRSVFTKITHFFVQNTSSRDTIISKVADLNPTRITVAGDPRIDRVLDIAKSAIEFPIVEQFCYGKKILVAGSTWKKDVEILKRFQNFPDWKLIIAPHELNETHYLQIENQWENERCLRYSNATAENTAAASVLIIDNIGMLSSLYRYARIAYIGGGFGAGIHNTLEPMAFGIPVIFGPKYRQFEESYQMVEAEGAFSVRNSDEFILKFNMLSNIDFYNKASETIKKYMADNRGATNKIFEYCKTILHQEEQNESAQT